MKKFLDTGNFLISEILFLKADFRFQHSGCIMHTFAIIPFFQKNSDLEIIFLYLKLAGVEAVEALEGQVLDLSRVTVDV